MIKEESETDTIFSPEKNMCHGCTRLQELEQELAASANTKMAQIADKFVKDLD